MSTPYNWPDSLHLTTGQTPHIPRQTRLSTPHSWPNSSHLASFPTVSQPERRTVPNIPCAANCGDVASLPTPILVSSCFAPKLRSDFTTCLRHWPRTIKPCSRPRLPPDMVSISWQEWLLQPGRWPRLRPTLCISSTRAIGTVCRKRDVAKWRKIQDVSRPGERKL